LPPPPPPPPLPGMLEAVEPSPPAPMALEEAPEVEEEVAELREVEPREALLAKRLVIVDAPPEAAEPVLAADAPPPVLGAAGVLAVEELTALVSIEEPPLREDWPPLPPTLDWMITTVAPPAEKEEALTVPRLPRSWGAIRETYRSAVVTPASRMLPSRVPAWTVTVRTTATPSATV
jgi:hypothetical protein